MLKRLLASLGKSRPATFINEGIASRVEVRTVVRCICGAAEPIVLPSLAARVSCDRCHRVYGVRALAYTQMSATPDRDAKVYIDVGYFVPRDDFAAMTPVGQPQ